MALRKWFLVGFIDSLLSLRRGITLSRSSSPKIGRTLGQTLFKVVLLLYHSKIFENWKLKHSSNFQISTAQFRVRRSSDQNPLVQTLTITFSENQIQLLFQTRKQKLLFQTSNQKWLFYLNPSSCSLFLLGKKPTC